MITDFILASASTRRLDLLESIGLIPKKIVPAQIDETPAKGETIINYAKRMAVSKAWAVANANPGENVLAADTVVTRGRLILDKTTDEVQARCNLKLLSGRRHKVLTAVCMIAKNGKQSLKLSTTVVKFKVLTPHEIDTYIASGEWQDKAGSYAIQGKAAAFINYIGGSYSGVVGLPLFETACIFNGAEPSTNDKP